MNRTMRKLSVAILAGSAFAAGMVWTGELPVGQAEAVIGRPLTPVSAAGVARRSTVRATSAANADAAAASAAAASSAAAAESAAAAAAAAAPPAAPAIPAGCERVVGPDGVAYTRCP